MLVQRALPSWASMIQPTEQFLHFLVSFLELIRRVLVCQLGNSWAWKGIFSFIFPEGIGRGVLCSGL